MSASSTDRFRRVDDLLDAVFDLPIDEQTAFVAKACGDDLELRTEVLQLLSAHRRTGSILDAPVANLVPRLFNEPGTEAAIPDRIGPFKVERAIGEGGMGQVFLGHRADKDFEQRVAIKVIRHPIPGLVRRFLEERRILARLEHPHIARLVNGGVTADGLPYFAMEFVDGEPIDRYCESHELSLDDRLGLFERVCEAVSYAHRHLIIHRDLKPANILVTHDGIVKLLDFGIAKLISAGEHGSLGETQTGLRVMTPEAAAPEQFLGAPISTATDVYALGILLYRLVTNERPFDFANKTPGEIERMVCTEMPAPPSTKAPNAFRRRMRGDLDLIVMTALQKAESRRYQSAADFASDIKSFRHGRVIRARPDSVGYRVRTFVARHRTAVAVAGIAAIGVVAALMRESVLRNRAELETRKARAVEDFLIGVFGGADPYDLSARDPGAVTARELLDRGARRIDSVLVSQPEVQADLRSELGRVYTNLGLFDRARPLLEASLSQRVSLGANDSSTASTMDLLGQTLAQQDKQDDAERLLRQALKRRRRLFGNTNILAAESMEHLATLLEDRNRYDEAESLHREVLAINQRLFGDSAIEVAVALNNLGLVRFRRGAADDAEPLYRRALATALPRLGERHPLTAEIVHNLAQTLERMGKLDEAERLYRRSLAAKQAALGEAHPSVTIGLNNLAFFLANKRDRLDEAETLARRAIALDRQTFGDKHSYVGEGLRNLGVILRMKGRFIQSDSAIQEALAIDRALFGERHEKIANLLGQSAQGRFLMGDSRGAIRDIRESLDQYRSLFGETHLNTLVTTGNLARMLLETGNAVEAESLARQALSHLDSARGSDRTAYITVRRTLGASLLAQHRVAEALPILSRALAMARQEFGDENFRTAAAEMSYGSALAANGQSAEAEPLLRSALRIAEAHRADQPILVTQARAAMAALTTRAIR